MSVAIDSDSASMVDKDSYDEEFSDIESPDEQELSHTSTGTASCYLPCHTASKLPCCDSTN